MTKKELKALMPLLGIINSAASEIDYYSVDYDVRDLGHIADKIKGGSSKLQKGG